MLSTGTQRYLPRAGFGAGATTRQETALRAEMTLLQGHLQRLEREQAVQLTRIAQLQQQLDRVEALLAVIASKRGDPRSGRATRKRAKP